ncbi:MAG: YkgJ family cysteine cluster protein [Phycisphaerae bacterium]
MRISENPQQPPEPGDSCTEFSLPVGGGFLNVRLFAPKGKTAVGAVMPAARALADEQVRLLRERLVADGEHVPCKPGCSACCRFLVPISPPEAVRLIDELAKLPRARRKAFHLSFARSAMRIRAAGPPPASHGLAAISRWYANLHLDCPLLQDDLCSIYPLRPLACREFLATHSAELCARPDPADCQAVSPPVSIAEAIANLWGELDADNAGPVLLPLSPAWALRNAAPLRKTFPTVELAERLAGILNSMSTRTAAGGCAAA